MLLRPSNSRVRFLRNAEIPLPTHNLTKRDGSVLQPGLVVPWPIEANTVRLL